MNLKCNTGNSGDYEINSCEIRVFFVAKKWLEYFQCLKRNLHKKMVKRGKMRKKCFKEVFYYLNNLFNKYEYSLDSES